MTDLRRVMHSARTHTQTHLSQHGARRIIEIKISHISRTLFIRFYHHPAPKCVFVVAKIKRDADNRDEYEYILCEYAWHRGFCIACEDGFVVRGRSGAERRIICWIFVFDAPDESHNSYTCEFRFIRFLCVCCSSAPLCGAYLFV